VFIVHTKLPLLFYAACSAAVALLIIFCQLHILPIRQKTLILSTKPYWQNVNFYSYWQNVDLVKYGVDRLALALSLLLFCCFSSFTIFFLEGDSERNEYSLKAGVGEE